jgi:hypothetical protein
VQQAGKQAERQRHMVDREVKELVSEKRIQGPNAVVRRGIVRAENPRASKEED